MVSEIYDINYILVDNENDALILENSLIKQLKPKYNILLRDDKTYPYIFINFSEKFPRLAITRKVLKGKKIKYFGPYSSGVKDMLESIYDIVPLVQRKSGINNGKACLFYQMGKCLAPCENKITQKEYLLLLNEAVGYIQNKSALILQLEQKMEKYSSQVRFEEAMTLRDKIKSIKKSQVKSTLDFAKDEDYDLFIVELGLLKAIVVKMFVRNGKLISTTHKFVNISEDLKDPSEIYKSAIIGYYSLDLPYVPKNILVAFELEEKSSLEDFISNKFNKKVSFIKPKIGQKKQLLDVAFKNCVELLKIDKINTNKINNDLKELFDLYKVPNRFECFDNSHMMGQATVGAMVVWDNDKFIKEDYRLYNLDSRDEYSQMREILMRRVAKFEENSPPDMWIIDGGLTLLNLANDICKSAGVNIDMIAISKEKIDAKANRAKGKANDILYTLDNKIKLTSSDKRLQFIQMLRDESHRVAINFHKKQKRKEDKQISLLSIKGIGDAKVQKLLNYFGTFEAIKESKLNDLKEVLNEKDSILVSNYFIETDKNIGKNNTQ